MAALSVLVVDDDAMIATLLAEMLETMGYGVCAIAATEEDAVAAATRCKPGLMIVDEHLREGTGASAVKRILLTGSVPYIVISGAPVNRDGQGATILRKPFFVQDLVRAIQNAVGDVQPPPAIIPSMTVSSWIMKSAYRCESSQHPIKKPPTSMIGN
jgi:CheY-like chemotaxis protein